jgi:hypothetical protein
VSKLEVLEKISPFSSSIFILFLAQMKRIHCEKKNTPNPQNSSSI